MGVFVFLPLVLPLTAWPVARLAEHRLHPRLATRLLSAVAAVLGLCSSLCLGLLAIVGTAQLPGNPLPDGWADPEVRAAVPHDEVVGKSAVCLLAAAAAACAALLLRHRRVRRRTARALRGLPAAQVAVLPDPMPYAHTVPGRGRAGGRILVSTGMLAGLTSRERRVLFAHERAHLTGRHHRHLLLAGLAARANPFLRPLRTAVVYTVERWADEEAAATVGDRRTAARAIAKAALISRPAPAPTMAALAAPAGPVPRRVAALLGPAPAARAWPPLFTTVGVAAWTAAAGAALSAMSSANSAVTMFLILKAATPL
ncbi:M48 family metalloprotease [Streptomyces sp. NBC_01275]|uniref:M48 family metalloprotease n=1 Tax=Streptomyces sp. NBC_01275 TaxID=2903807 RepID=UPI0022534EAA|nr:M48 family metalloprotease [Streptomyces sp. NBC_01275]MCX4763454.1 M48 family metalloprotease [Streptomyces sp. NBC_01275]